MGFDPHEGKSGEAMNNWLTQRKDGYAKTADGISEFTTSIRAGRTMEEIEEGADENITRNPFSKADVQLAKLASSVLRAREWLYELKYDGYRILAYLEGNNARLITRTAR